MLIHKYIYSGYSIGFDLRSEFSLPVNASNHTKYPVNASNHTKFVSLSNQKCEIHPTFINLHPNEYSQELYYYPLTTELGKCIGN